ncbi:MAG: dihydroorotase [Erysipelotrichaceae bacterium]
MLLKNGKVFINNQFVQQDIFIFKDKVFYDYHNYSNVIDCSNLIIVPGFIDVHTHLREPGFSYKETIKTGSKAALLGGFTTIHAMANLNPIPDTIEKLNQQLAIIEKDAYIKVVPYGAITKNLQGRELAELDKMSNFVAGFSDDGVGIQNPTVLKQAMLSAKKLNKPLVLHCEDITEVNNGVIHQGTYAKDNKLAGINSKSEYQAVKIAAQLALETGCHTHICHISTKESVEIIKEYKKLKANISCEVTPHHLILCENDIKNDDGNYKMNPPLRSNEDKKALIKALQDGTIDILATDHAPHSLKEKNQGLIKSSFGIIGLQHAFSLMYTHFVKSNIITLEKLIDLMSIQPAKIFNYPHNLLNNGDIADLSIIDLKQSQIITVDNIVSLSKNTPFLNTKVDGKVIKVIVNGELVLKEENL